MGKPKFNILDSLILLLVVLVAAAGIYLFGGRGESSNTTDTQNVTAVFKIQLTQADYSLYEKFVKATDSGEKVWIGLKERFAAEIIEVEATPSAKITTNTNRGTLHLAENPTLYDLNITFKAPATETADSISASGTAIRVGVEEAIHGKGIAGFGYITDLKTTIE